MRSGATYECSDGSSIDVFDVTKKFIKEDMRKRDFYSDDMFSMIWESILQEREKAKELQMRAEAGEDMKTVIEDVQKKYINRGE